MEKAFAWFGLKGSLVLTMLLSALSLVLAVVFRTPIRWLCFAAMLMSSVGDIFLMHFKGIEERFPNFFVVGAAFFMLAHLLYTACFALKICDQGSMYMNGGAAAALVIAVLSLIYFTSICKNKSQLPLAVAYLAIITLNCMTVFSFAWLNGIGDLLAVLAAIGATSFLASDLIIGFGLLANIHRYDYLIWWLYPIGQLLLIIGAGR